ncbi:phenylacetic acid degradation bifunctional protein PaaZ [Streptomyces griseiscabiei]|uniref:Phenylacetic acid degradation bifunctional protein PaaZ n=1 Tax=Streptomyces griseiscabiei TaxID=2993540 RepID=A0ABU4L474_9ACTN|nr:phenylacetic acid degradation bifunctional protein PaaZ [Streptomyces griseiscabiei]MBZ3901542.1 phenylacetic acid degradation bifunctional protein PaaZ [Streptomyces griseiscabiei]MDX2909908.1 phenylacetic acid degradation bifunctional protein PaaZ [Streptomyces griseiscabiei]
MNALRSYVQDRWHTPTEAGTPVRHAVTGEVVAHVSSAGVDMAAALHHARTVGGPALRALSFHRRARLLTDLAAELRGHREELYALSATTGATLFDSKYDIDGGLRVVRYYAALGGRELPGGDEGSVYVEGEHESLGRDGTFLGGHIATPLRGAAVQINAYNFPVWAPLEKLAPAVLAGVPSLIKPATQTAQLTSRLVELVVESGLLPPGSLQFVCGGAGDLLDHVTEQDLVSFTGSAATAERLRTHPAVVRQAVRFNAEADSVNCSVLGPDATPGTPEFDLYVDQLVTEMTVKAGQKCTAIRRALVPAALMDAVSEAAAARLAEVVVGDPADPSVRMGALASLGQREEVRRRVKTLLDSARLVSGDPDHGEFTGADGERGAFLTPLLLRCDDPGATAPHEVEAFGPVSTLIPYTSPEHAVFLAARGRGSLAASVVTGDADFARRTVVGLAPWHGRVLVLDAGSAKSSTGHGAPLPALIHGGPGRAGGGEELGGMRGVLHHMRRTAVQGGPRMLTALTGRA